jgi:hypothetical protein
MVTCQTQSRTTIFRTLTNDMVPHTYKWLHIISDFVLIYLVRCLNWWWWNPSKLYKKKITQKRERKNKERGPKSKPKAQKSKEGHKGAIELTCILFHLYVVVFKCPNWWMGKVFKMNFKLNIISYFMFVFMLFELHQTTCKITCVIDVWLGMVQKTRVIHIATWPKVELTLVWHWYYLQLSDVSSLACISRRIWH